MKPGLSVQRFHEALLHDLFGHRPEEADVLCLMLLLHACRIVLSKEATLKEGVRGFEGITTRHAAEAIASLFSDQPKADHDYWYRKWNGEWDAYGILNSSVSSQMKVRLRYTQEIVESHPWIAQLEDDDWSILSEIRS